MRFSWLVNRYAVTQAAAEAKAKSFVTKALVLIAGFAALCGVAFADALVEVQIYENMTVFPGEPRFFMTSREADKAFLAAHPQMGWTKLDTFAAFAVDPNAPNAANLSGVCRFYLPTLATHFFTASSADCEQFKADPLFKFEGIDFAVVRPVAGGCGIGLTSVVRFYNNGFARDVSGNHFYGTGTGTGIGNYLARFAGWWNEGAVMCVPETVKATTRVVVAGRSDVIQVAGTAALAKGLPIAQILSTDSEQSKTFVDTLGGDSDWLSRTAYDELRGKLYLIRANTVTTACCVGNDPSSPSGPPVSTFVTVRPTRATNNVMEIDVATGAMRYLALGGAYTDIHYNAERRLLLLASVGSNQETGLTWFDPQRNTVVSTATSGGVAYDAALRHIGNASCEYLLEKTSIFFAASFPFGYPAALKKSGCVDGSGVVKALPTLFPTTPLSKFDRGGCVVGDSLYAGLSQLSLTSLSMLPDLPRVGFGIVTLPSQPNYQTLGCFARGTSLYAVIYAHYANLTSGYFVVEFRNGVVVNSIGPLTELVNYFPNSPISSYQGRQPSFLSATDTRFARSAMSGSTEIWAVSPQYVDLGARPVAPPRDLLRRLNAATFQPIGEVEIAVPSRYLHLSTR